MKANTSHFWREGTFIALFVVLVLAVLAIGISAAANNNQSNQSYVSSGNYMPTGNPGTPGNPDAGNRGNFNPVFGQTMSFTDWWGAYQASNPTKKGEVARAYERMTGYTVSSAKGFAQVEKVKGIGYYRVILVSNTSVSDAQARFMASIGGADTTNIPIVRVSGIENTWLHGNQADVFWDASSQVRLALVVPKQGWTLEHGFKKAGVLALCGNPWRAVHGKHLSPPPPGFIKHHPGLTPKNWRLFSHEPKPPKYKNPHPIGTMVPTVPTDRPAGPDPDPVGGYTPANPKPTATPDSGSGATHTTQPTATPTNTPAPGPTDTPGPGDPGAP